MERLLSNFKISVQDSIYSKDPESSSLGKKIVEHGILLIDEIGFEAFTFKKLGVKIGSNESSIYRYFDNKHKLLIYLTSWYWAWIEYRMVIETHSISDPKEKLIKAISITTQTVKEDSTYTHVNEVLLNKIIISENSKSFLTKEVDTENQEGFFVTYKRVVSRIKDMISSLNTSYEYPASLASTIMEAGLHQHFLKEHFVSITDCSSEVSPTDFLIDLVLKTLEMSEK
jgi:AcrR family transcriptional regulator